LVTNTQEEKAMRRRVSEVDQLPLFSKQLRWTELPTDVRQRACQLLALLCLEVIQDDPKRTEEQKHEPRVDSILAP
jgi:hypothetical protein